MATLTDIIKVTNDIEGNLYDLFSNDSSFKFFHENLLKENFRDYFDGYADYESDINMYGYVFLYQLEFSYHDKEKYYVDIRLYPRDFYNSKLSIHVRYGFGDVLQDVEYHVIEDQEEYMKLLDVLADFIEHIYEVASRDFKGNNYIF